MVSAQRIHTFQETVLSYYRTHKRLLPWRETINPYWVVLSEIMLQQTQVPRVLVKFPEFLEAFPTFQSLADAPLADVLTTWQGMGYNRRGKYLQEIAQKMVHDFGGVVPHDPLILESFPGIGPATARSIVVYTYNIPELFIETNVRRVFIHHFFQDRIEIHDKEILLILKQSLRSSNPREWYYALMDYGTFLAKHVPNPNRKSKHYSKQSKFEGSPRQVRSYSLKVILAMKEATIHDIVERTGFGEARILQALKELMREGMITQSGKVFHIVQS